MTVILRGLISKKVMCLKIIYNLYSLTWNTVIVKNIILNQTTVGLRYCELLDFILFMNIVSRQFDRIQLIK